MSLFVALAWLLPLFGVGGMGAPADAGYALNAMIGCSLYRSAGRSSSTDSCTRFWRRRSAAMIGWQTNGFQYEIGFVSYGSVSPESSHRPPPRRWRGSWFRSSCQCFCSVQRPTTLWTFRDKNFKPGNSVILIYDIGLPASLIILLIANGVIF